MAAATADGGFGDCSKPQDFSKVEIKTTKITDKFYTLEGQGGMIGALVGPDGVFLVDTQFAPLSEKIVAAVKKISTSPIKFVVNTHVHGDHTGGNENFGKMGAVIFSRDQLRARLARPAGNAAACACGGVAGRHLRRSSHDSHERRRRSVDSDPFGAHGRRHARALSGSRCADDRRLLPIDSDIPTSIAPTAAPSTE